MLAGTVRSVCKMGLFFSMGVNFIMCLWEQHYVEMVRDCDMVNMPGEIALNESNRKSERSALYHPQPST